MTISNQRVLTQHWAECPWPLRGAAGWPAPPAGLSHTHKRQLPLLGMSTKAEISLWQPGWRNSLSGFPCCASRSESPPVLIWDPLPRTDPISLESECHRQANYSHVLTMCFPLSSTKPLVHSMLSAFSSALRWSESKHQCRKGSGRLQKLV